MQVIILELFIIIFQRYINQYLSAVTIKRYGILVIAFAEDIFLGDTGHLFNGLVPRHYPALCIDNKSRIREKFYYLIQPSMGFMNMHLGVFHRRNVLQCFY